MLKKRCIAIGAATLLLPAVIGFAAPAQAAAGFVMPSIDGMNLQEAEDAVNAASNGVPLTMHSHNLKGIKQNPTRHPNLWQRSRKGVQRNSPRNIKPGVKVPLKNLVARLPAGCPWAM